MPQKGLKPFCTKLGRRLGGLRGIAAILVVLLMPKGQKKAVNASTAVYPGDALRTGTSPMCTANQAC